MFKEPQRCSSITEAHSTHAPALGASTLGTGDASDLEKVIGVHAVDQETLERDVALEVLYQRLQIISSMYST